MTDSRSLIAALFMLAATLLAFPALAGSETGPTIEAENIPGSGPYSEEHHAWSPSQATVGEGGVVTFKNPGATVPHGVEWVGGPSTPVCSGVPVGTSPAASGTNWSGTCTFTHPGTYTFYCTVHGREMSGAIVVPGAGTPAPGPTPLPGGGGGSSPPVGGTPGGSTGAGGSPLAGGVHALTLAASQHGGSVRGTIDIAAAGVGGKLEVTLFAKGSSLGSRRVAKVRIGRYVRSSLHAGTNAFVVSLIARARTALRRLSRLALTVHVVLTPVLGGAPAVIVKNVVLHR